LQPKVRFQLFKFVSQVLSREARQLIEGLSYDCIFAEFQKNILSVITKFILLADSDHGEHASQTNTVFECFKNEGLFDAVINNLSNSDVEISQLANECVLKCGILKTVCEEVYAADPVVSAAAFSRLRRTLQACVSDAAGATVPHNNTLAHCVRLLKSFDIPSAVDDCTASICLLVEWAFKLRAVSLVCDVGAMSSDDEPLDAASTQVTVLSSILNEIGSSECLAAIVEDYVDDGNLMVGGVIDSAPVSHFSGVLNGANSADARSQPKAWQSDKVKPAALRCDQLRPSPLKTAPASCICAAVKPALRNSDAL
jgi:hypothetical protein